MNELRGVTLSSNTMDDYNIANFIAQGVAMFLMSGGFCICGMMLRMLYDRIVAIESQLESHSTLLSEDRECLHRLNAYKAGQVCSTKPSSEDKSVGTDASEVDTKGSEIQECIGQEDVDTSSVSTEDRFTIDPSPMSRTVSRVDEIDILNGFKGYEFETLATVRELAQAKGFTLRVLRFDDEDMYGPDMIKDPNVIGISVRAVTDHVRSDSSIIVEEFLNVGG